MAPMLPGTARPAHRPEAASPVTKVGGDDRRGQAGSGPVVGLACPGGATDAGAVPAAAHAVGARLATRDLPGAVGRGLVGRGGRPVAARPRPVLARPGRGRGGVRPGVLPPPLAADGRARHLGADPRLRGGCRPGHAGLDLARDPAGVPQGRARRRRRHHRRPGLRGLADRRHRAGLAHLRLQRRDHDRDDGLGHVHRLPPPAVVDAAGAGRARRVGAGGPGGPGPHQRAVPDRAGDARRPGPPDLADLGPGGCARVPRGPRPAGCATAPR